MSETGAMPGDSHFIDWDLLGKQILAERRRLLVVAAAAVTAAGSEDRSQVLLASLLRDPLQHQAVFANRRVLP